MPRSAVAEAMEPVVPLPLAERSSSKRRSRRSSNPDFIPPSVIAACKTGDAAVVSQFLSVLSNLLQLDMHAEDTYTLLHVAAESGTAKVVELLLANGASQPQHVERPSWAQPRQGIARVPLLVVGRPPRPRRAEKSCSASSQRPASPVFHCQPLGGAASTTTGRRRCTWRARRGTSMPSKARCMSHAHACMCMHLHMHCTSTPAKACCLPLTAYYSLLTTHYSLLTTYYSTPLKASPEESARSSRSWTSTG